MPVLKRYYLIIEKIKNTVGASMEEIQEHLLNNDEEISHRTLQRDFRDIRTNFGVEIAYQSKSNTYVIDAEHSFNLNGFFQYLELSLSAESIREVLSTNNSLLRYVEFDGVELISGQENLKKILEAITLKRKITFSYEKYTEPGVKKHEVIPSLVKRYQNRWYVIAKNSTGHTITFGLDRIKELKITAVKFTEEQAKVKHKLDAVVGLNYTGEPTRVLLQADPIQAKYLQALPLHHSQKIVTETAKHTQFEYYLIPNFELRQAILRLGEQVKVLEPTDLVAEVRESLKAALEHYKS
jgi:predicted DNA-binding transcriptional regulator YafY